jgi:hypothetical protein
METLTLDFDTEPPPAPSTPFLTPLEAVTRIIERRGYSRPEAEEVAAIALEHARDYLRRYRREAGYWFVWAPAGPPEREVLAGWLRREVVEGKVRIGE